jgi:hypothetical protein
MNPVWLFNSADQDKEHKKMACELEIRDDVSMIILPIYQHAAPSGMIVTEETPLGDDTDDETGLGLNEDAQRGFIGPVSDAVSDKGCQLTDDIGPDDFIQDTVADVIDRVCADLGIPI